MPKRYLTFFAGVLLCFTLLICRLMTISTNVAYAQAAHTQSVHDLPLDDGRGNFFDCRFRKLTGISSSTYALASPTAESYKMLFEAVPETQRENLYSNIQRSVPFLIGLRPDVSVDCLTYLKTRRYAPMPFAPQLLGYRNAEGQGVAGLEAACDSVLTDSATKRSIFCAVSAKGDFIDAQAPREVESYGNGAGIMLTLDASLQRMCESIAGQMIDKGCIVVMETATGRVRACVSMPTFDPSNLAESLAAEDTAFINRAISNFNVGSVYKPLLAGAALEAGISPDETYECEGSIEVDGHVYRCAHGKGHGTVTMSDALAVSCNGYFIQLGQRLGPDAIVQYSQTMGLGESTVIFNTFKTARGNLPTVEDLQNTGALASVSFGQGTLLATPLQITAFMNTIANGGVYLSPTLVEGIVNEYTGEVTQSLYDPVIRQGFQPQTVSALQDMLIDVVENGLGKEAKPLHGMAAGKTSSAQTGRYDEDGEEIMDAWFAGYYPAEQPQYTIAVLLDSGTHSSEDACKVFSKVSSALYYFIHAPKPEEALSEEEQVETPDMIATESFNETKNIT